jgi:hypothetical protein
VTAAAQLDNCWQHLCRVDVGFLRKYKENRTNARQKIAAQSLPQHSSAYGKPDPDSVEGWHNWGDLSNPAFPATKSYQDAIGSKEKGLSNMNLLPADSAAR